MEKYAHDEELQFAGVYKGDAYDSRHGLVELVGSNSGVTDEYQCGRHMLNLESVFTYEGTHDIHTLIVGQDVTGLAAFDS